MKLKMKIEVDLEMEDKILKDVQNEIDTYIEQMKEDEDVKRVLIKLDVDNLSDYRLFHYVRFEDET